MSRVPIWLAVVTAIVTVLLVGAVALSSAQTIYVEVGTVKTSFSASVKPRALSANKRKPIGVRLSSLVQSKETAHIPAIARAEIGIDRSLAVDARGVPVCTAVQLENQTTQAAEAICAAATVGRGSLTVELATTGGPPVRANSKLLAFNGGVAGRTTTLLIHAHLLAPVSQAIVVPITLTKLPKGGYGMLAQAAIPTIAGGAGSLARFDLTIRRQVPTASGKKHGYLLAKCSDGNFVFEPEVQFDDGNLARGLLAQGCDSQR